MPSQEDIQDQLSLLMAHRRTLAGYLKQLANLGSQYAPPSLFNGIREARDNIKRIKKTLRDWNIPFENHPDDTDEADRNQIQATLKQLATRQLEDHVRQRLSFSAWEITLALREEHPDIVILHDDVKQIVHIYMQSVIRSGKYTRKNDGIPGSTFIRYVPA